MRRPRLKAPDDFPSAIYHCVSRVVDRQIVLHDVEKEQFIHYMRMYEQLFGLSIITYCVMGNHFAAVRASRVRHPAGCLMAG